MPGKFSCSGNEGECLTPSGGGEGKTKSTSGALLSLNGFLPRNQTRAFLKTEGTVFSSCVTSPSLSP